MKVLFALLTALAVTSLTPSSSLGQAPAPKGKVKVGSVTTVTLSLTRTTGRVKVEVTGEVPTTGWTNATLVETKSMGGTVNLDFVADKPAGPAGQVVSQVSAYTTVAAHDGEMKVIVHAARGTKEATIQIGAGH